MAVCSSGEANAALLCSSRSVPMMGDQKVPGAHRPRVPLVCGICLVGCCGCGWRHGCQVAALDEKLGHVFFRTAVRDGSNQRPAESRRAAGTRDLQGSCSALYSVAGAGNVHRRGPSGGGRAAALLGRPRLWSWWLGSAPFLAKRWVPLSWSDPVRLGQISTKNWTYDVSRIRDGDAIRLLN